MRNSSPTIGKLSGEDDISKIWRQSKTIRSAALSHTAWPQHDGPRASFVFDFRFEHHRRGTGNSAVLTHAPEVDAHENSRDQRNGDAMPDVGAKKCVRIDDRAAEKRKS